MLAMGSTDDIIRKIQNGLWKEGPWKQSGSIIAIVNRDSPSPFPQGHNKLTSLVLDYSSTPGFSGGPVIEVETGHPLHIRRDGGHSVSSRPLVVARLLRNVFAWVSCGRHHLLVSGSSSNWSSGN